jgi:C4-type Zn-finger protein
VICTRTQSNSHDCPVCNIALHAQKRVSNATGPYAAFVVCDNSRHFEYCCYRHLQDVAVMHELMGCKLIHRETSVEYRELKSD